MANENSASNSIPTLPKVPKQDIWGRDIPLPNKGDSAEQMADAVVESVGDLAEQNAEIFKDVVFQFQRYTETIKDSNQNFLLKQGRLMLNTFRQAVVEGMIEGAEKNGTLGDPYLHDLLDEQGMKLEQLIQAQITANNMEAEAQETAREQSAQDKNEKAKEKENEREGWLRRFFTSSNNGLPDAKDKKKKDDDGGGFFSGLLGNIAFTIPAIKALIPLMAGLSLFFIDFEKFVKNPMWEKVSKLITEKLIPGVSYLFENVISPLANFLVHTTLPAVITGLIEAFDDIVVLVKDVISAFEAEDWKEGLDKGVKAFVKFIGNIGNTLLNFTLEAVGIDSEKWRTQLEKDWEETKTMWSDFFGKEITGYFKSFVGFLEETMDPEERERVAMQARKDWAARWEAFVGYWNNAVDSVSKQWNELKTTFSKESIQKDWEETKKIWSDRWETVKGGAAALIDGISKRWEELTNPSVDPRETAKLWEETKAKWSERKDKIIDAFWSVIDSIRDSVVQAMKELSDYFSALPGRIWTYIMDSVKTIPGAEWMLEKLGYPAETPTSSLAPVRNIMIENAARENNMGGIPDFIGGMNRFSGATDAFKADSKRNDSQTNKPLILTPQVNQSAVTTTVGGPTYMSRTRTGSDRSFFGAK